MPCTARGGPWLIHVASHDAWYRLRVQHLHSAFANGVGAGVHEQVQGGALARLSRLVKQDRTRSADGVAVAS